MGRPRLSVLRLAPAVAMFTVMAVPWLTTQAHQARDAQVVPFDLAAPDQGVGSADWADGHGAFLWMSPRGGTR